MVRYLWSFVVCFVVLYLCYVVKGGGCFVYGSCYEIILWLGCFSLLAFEHTLWGCVLIV